MSCCNHKCNEGRDCPHEKEPDGYGLYAWVGGIVTVLVFLVLFAVKEMR